MAGVWSFSKAGNLNNLTTTPSSPNPESSFEDTPQNSLDKNINSILSFLDSSPVADGAEDKDDLPVTQPLHILKGVVAYVEVRSNNENRSQAVERELLRLGATVAPKFSADVTHVIFRNGKRSTVSKAQKKGLHLVSVLWVDSCKRNEERVPESPFQATLTEQEKGTPNLLIGRLKKAKSMQPKDFEEEVARSAERDRKKRLKKAAKADKWNILNSPATPSFSPVRTMGHKTDNQQFKFYVAETQPRSPDDESPPNLRTITIPDTPPSMKETVNRIKAFREKLEDPNYDPRSDSEEEPPTPPVSTEPLQRRLFGLQDEASGSSPVCTSTQSEDNSLSGMAAEPCNNTKLKRQLSGKRKLLAMDSQPTEDLVVPSKTSGAAQSKPKLFEPAVKRKREKPVLNKSSDKDSSLEKPRRKSRRLSLQVTGETSKDIQPLEISRVPKGRRRSGLPSTFNTAEPLERSQNKSEAEDSPKLETTVNTPNSSLNGRGLNELEDSIASAGGEGYSTAYSLLTQSTNTTLLNLTKSRRSTLEFRNTKFRKPIASSKVPSTSQLNNGPSVKSKSSTNGNPKPLKSSSQRKIHRSSSSDQADTSSGLENTREDGRETKTSQRSAGALQRTLVTTSLHNHEQDTVRAVIKKFGGLEYAENVTSTTSHLVCGGQRRTLNVLRAIAQGCWIISLEWVLKSVEAGHFLPEEPYELETMFPAAKANRKAKQENDETYQCPLFADQGIIYVTENSKPPQKDILSLISLCGGKVTTTARQAHICVGRHMKAITNCVTEHWILDSITLNKVQPLDKYKIP